MIHTVKCFGVVNKAKVDVFLEFSCFFYDPTDAGNFISGFSAFSKSSLNIWSSFLPHKSPCWSLGSLSQCHTVHRRDTSLGFWVSHAQCPECTDMTRYTTREAGGSYLSGCGPGTVSPQYCVEHSLMSYKTGVTIFEDCDLTQMDAMTLKNPVSLTEQKQNSKGTFPG